MNLLSLLRKSRSDPCCEAVAQVRIRDKDLRKAREDKRFRHRFAESIPLPAFVKGLYYQDKPATDEFGEQTNVPMDTLSLPTDSTSYIRLLPESFTDQLFASAAAYRAGIHHEFFHAAEAYFQTANMYPPGYEALINRYLGKTTDKTLLTDLLVMREAVRAANELRAAEHTYLHLGRVPREFKEDIERAIASHKKDLEEVPTIQPTYIRAVLQPGNLVKVETRGLP